MISFAGPRTVAVFGHSISSYEVKRILVGPVLVHHLPTPLAICPALYQNPYTLATSPSACLCAVAPPFTTIALVSFFPGACLCASDSKTIPSLIILTEADFDIFLKLGHEEVVKPVRRYGAGIAPVEKKAEFVKIDDDDSPLGWECSFIDDYLPRAGEEKQTDKGKEKEKQKENEEREGWEMSLLGVYVVDQ